MINETLKTLEDRRSCRCYKDELIEDEKLEAILKAGTYAATGMNRQSPIMIAVTNSKMRDKLSKLNASFLNSDTDPFYGAPELIIVLAKADVSTHVYDGSLVMGNLMNAAESLGVKSCWIHRAKEMFASEEGKAILKDLGIEGEYEGIGNLILGYSDCGKIEAKPRKENYIYYIR